MIKERESNIELFRIVATLMILVVHCNGWFLQDWGGITTWSAGRGLIVGGTRALIQSATCIGVDCFILISGYFSIKPKLKSIFNLYTILLFFYSLSYIISTTICSLEAFSFEGFFYNCICAFSKKSWFIQGYLFLMLMSPILNAFVEKCSKKQLLTYIGILLAFLFYFGCIWEAPFFFINKGYSGVVFIPIYLVGRYIKLYGMQYVAKKPKYYSWIGYGITLISITLFRTLCNSEQRWLSYESPLIILSASCLLICFAQMNFKNKFVNWMGTSCFAVFILHTSLPFITWLAEFDVSLFVNYPFAIYLLIMGGGVLVVCFLAILLDKIRIGLFCPLLKLFEKN